MNNLLIPNNFGGLSPEYSDPKSAKVVILPIPYEQTTSYKSGTREGPMAIINASRNVELYDDELEKNTYKVGIHTLSELEPDMRGPDKMVERIYGVSRHWVNKNKFLVVFGGEHSITSGIVRAYSEKYKDLSVLQFDAHADLRDSYLGTKFSHASAMRRTKEYAPVVHVGIRNISEEEAIYIKQNKTDIYLARDIITDDKWITKMINRLSDHVYISLDLDVFDPAIMPATGTPEPGGLGWYKVLKILKEVCRKKNIVGFDMVELAPLPGIIAPDFLAAKLAYKTMGYALQNVPVAQ